MNLEPFPLDERAAKLKKGIGFSWLSLIILPLGGFLGALGICAGPRNESGAFLLLAVGVAGIAVALYGGYQVVRYIRSGDWPARLIGVLSLAAGLAGATRVVVRIRGSRCLEVLPRLSAMNLREVWLRIRNRRGESCRSPRERRWTETTSVNHIGK